MILKTISLAFLAVAALALSTPPALQAAPQFGPRPVLKSNSMIEQIQAKKAAMDDPEDPDGAPAKTKAMRDDPKDNDGPPAKQKRAKKAAAKAGKCGTYLYWDRKTRKCADARDKK
jgi:hypothetical protein